MAQGYYSTPEMQLANPQAFKLGNQIPHPSIPNQVCIQVQAINPATGQLATGYLTVLYNGKDQIQFAGAFDQEGFYQVQGQPNLLVADRSTYDPVSGAPISNNLGQSYTVVFISHV